MNPTCRVLIKKKPIGAYLSFLLNKYEFLNKIMSSILRFDSSLPWKRHFSPKLYPFLYRNCRLQLLPSNHRDLVLAKSVCGQ